MGGGCSGVSSK